MNKLLTALLLSLAFSSTAVAAAPVTCDLEGSVTIYYKGELDGKAVSIGFKLPKSEVEVLHKRALKIVDEASKVQDKGGDYMIEFDETRRCGTEVSKGEGVAGVMVQGLTLQGVNKVARAFERQFSETIKEQEARARNGKKRSLGRD